MTNVAHAFYRYSPLLLLALAWEAAVRTGVISELVLPPFSSALTSWWDLTTTGGLFEQAAHSLKRAAIGLSLALILGTTAGILMAWNAKIRVFVNPLIQMVPILLVFAIFYFIILLPSKKKQKKLEEFLDSLKVGDRVVTSGGLYGSVTKVNDKSVQLQIANNVRVEVARHAVVGYQGQEALAESTHQGLN